MKTIVLGVDHGNRMVKSGDGMYNCGYMTYRNRPSGVDEYIEYNGKFHCIDSRSKYRYDKTIDDTYFILTLPALAMRMEKEGVSEANIVLGIGLPLSHFQLKEKYINYFTKEGIDFKYKNKRYVAHIKEVMCFPQAIGGFMVNYWKYKDVDFLNLLDIGQVTLDAVKIQGGKPVLESAISLNYGMLKLIKNIQENIRKATGIEISEPQIESTLQGKKSIYFQDDIENIIQTTTVDFINEMLDELRENGYELQATMNLLMGGGAIIIENILNLDKHNKRINYYELLPNPQLANALGFEMLAKEALRRR
ncbi:ParM/StbA family protein [Mobilitalea sibirica]|uniref:ParM/StbA family protein n=1 Tax=Mobilitalea sibirica TaxID=1462919 RepID=A0A8J7HCK9_9FIRM|nr:ParM/StbA family protein [Mobilitalea sibirica]MBH1941077.1 ParM/StbA family protein [Mobilitalea sibirica]